MRQNFRPYLESLEDRVTPAQVDVYTYVDYNQNGVCDPEDTPYNGVLTGVLAGGGMTYQQYQLTDSPPGFVPGGAWYFNVPEGEPVHVFALPPEGWMLTSPDHFEKSLVNSEVWVVKFGFALTPPPPPAQIDIVAFWDFNADGIWQPEDGESGVEGILVGVGAQDGSYQEYHYTTNEGTNWFLGVPSREQVWTSVAVPEDLVLTTPEVQCFNLEPGQVGIAYYGFVPFFDDGGL